MDKDKIIKKYNKLNEHRVKGRLADGGKILGEEVDQNNFLHYIVKRGDKLSVEEAQYTRVAEFPPTIEVRLVEHKSK